MNEQELNNRLLDHIDMWFNNESVMTAEDYDNLMLKVLGDEQGGKDVE